MTDTDERAREMTCPHTHWDHEVQRVIRCACYAAGEAAAVERSRRMAAVILVLFGEHITGDWSDQDGGDVQDVLEKHGITEVKPAPAGSAEAEEWGEGEPLQYLKPWVRRLADELGKK